MKPTLGVTTAVCFLFLAWPAFGASVDDVFKRALFDEEGRRDYDAAVHGYEEVVGMVDAQRRMAATAIYRLGECYRKLGRTNDAIAQYERLMRDFSSESALVQLCEQNLAGLQRTGPTTRTPVSSAARQRQRELLQQEIEIVERELTATQRQVQAGAASTSILAGVQRELLGLKRQLVAFEDPVLSSIPVEGVDAARDPAQEAALLGRQLEAMEKMTNVLQRAAALRVFMPSATTGIADVQQRLRETEVRLASLTARLAEGHPEVVADRQVQKFLQGELQAEVEALIESLRARLESLQSALGATEGIASASDPAAKADASTTLAPEEAAEIRRIQRLIANSPDLLNAPVSVEGGLTPLQSAASMGKLEIARFLLENGARVDIGTDAGTPLSLAANAGNRAMVELLLDRGAAVNTTLNTTPPDRRTPLHRAAQRGFLAVAELLIERGADLQYYASAGTPLMLAVEAGHVDMVRLLLAKGADPNPGVETRCALTLARSPEMIRLLLDAKADPDGGKGQRLLEAVQNGELEIARALLSAGAHPDRDEYSETPLVAAVMRDNREMAELLLKHGADIHRVSVLPGLVSPPYRRAVIHVVAEQISLSPKWVEWALNNGADPNLRTPAPEGATPLELTGVSRVDHEVWSPKEPSNTTSISVSVSGSFGPGTDLSPIEEASRIWEKARILLQRGADPGTAFVFNKGTIVHAAARSGRREEFDLLTEKKVDVQTRGPRGITPLMVAAASGNLPAMEWLLKSGADVNAQTDEGLTALHLAAPGNDGTAIESVRLLIRHGADASLMDREGQIATDPRGYAQQGTGEWMRVGRRFARPLPTPGGGPNRTTAQHELLKLVDASASATSSNITFFGAVKGTVPLEPGRTLTVSEALLSQSYPDTADLKRVKVHRASTNAEPGAILTIDVQSILRSNDRSKDLLLQPGDRVEVPAKLF